MPISIKRRINKNARTAALLCSLILASPWSISRTQGAQAVSPLPQVTLEETSSGNQADAPLQRAAQLNNQGLRSQSKQQTDAAIDSFLQAANLAEAIDTAQSLRYRLNATRAMLETGQSPAALNQLSDITRTLDQQTEGMPAIRLSVADLYRTLVNDLNESSGYRLQAFDQLTMAKQALSDDDHAQLTWVYGYQAALYEDEQRHDESLQLTRLAITEAQKASSSSALYRWEWQLGRNLARLGRQQDAVDAYARAAASLDQQRGALHNTQDSFDRIIRPFYYQYADLLLKQVAGASDEGNRQALLKQVQVAMEAVKAAEVEDYFQEQCIVENSTSLNDVTAGTAILYPVILDDRLELIMTANGELAHITVPVSKLEVVAAVRDFRLNLEVDTATHDYLRLAQQLYDWLLKPLESQLAAKQVDTLVVIPDGPLRTIPLSALHDGQQYLVERYSLATAPGLNLVTAAPELSSKPSAFAGGLSESVQGFSALPSVSAELDTIEKTLSARVLINQDFTTQALTQELSLGDYSIVHLATHGQFRSSYTDSFLLTHDDRLQIDELGDALLTRQSKKGALDLLVLSACETAAGDDRAALGLAGVAIKSGARSAMASLWEVDDAATKKLISAFYENLAAKESKARSLQQAQKLLIKQEEFNHPSNWAPFLIIGDWL